MGHHYTCATMVACLCWIYSLIEHSPEVSRTSDTGGHSHSPIVARHTVITTILLANQLWNHSSTLSMIPITTQLSPSYNNTKQMTACDLICCLTLLPSSVGLDIMGYESEPLPSHIWLRNCSYTISLKCILLSTRQSISRPMSWSHLRIHLITHGILSDPIHNYHLWW